MNEFNPYEAPSADVSGPAPEGVVLSGADTADEIRAFVGPRASSYLNQWWGLIDGRNANVGFNWPAFLFTGLWLPYRKMYKAAFLLYGLLIVEEVVENLIFQALLHRESPDALGRLIGIGIAIFCGFQANEWYFLHARRKIEMVRSLGLSESEHAAELARRGGTSLLACFGFFALFLLLAFTVGAIGELILGGAE